MIFYLFNTLSNINSAASFLYSRYVFLSIFTNNTNTTINRLGTIIQIYIKLIKKVLKKLDLNLYQNKKNNDNMLHLFDYFSFLFVAYSFVKVYILYYSYCKENIKQKQ